jgi:peptidoglycan-associated lipoprotein
MKNRMLKFCIPLALALAGGCATQSQPESAATAPGSDTASTSSSPSATARSDSRVTGRQSSSSRSSSSARGAAQPSARSVFFEVDNATLSAEDRKLVESHAQYLREHPDVKVRVEGNTDERGSKEYNLALGQRRAETVTKVMELMGVSDQRVEAVSYGEEKPRSQGHEESAWQQNRRSDIRY